MMIAVLAGAGATCDPLAPEPQSFHSRGFGVVAEVFPPGSRHNAGERPRIYTYEVGYPGPRWDVDARRVWSATLQHGHFPHDAVVSMEGHVVTLDDYFQVGGENAVVLLDRLGRELRAYGLSDLLTEAEIADLEWSDCGILWRTGAGYYFLLGASPRFYVVLGGGPVLEFDLVSGALRRGANEAFPELAEILAKPWPNEEAEVWRTSLRFSSLTDLVGGG